MSKRFAASAKSLIRVPETRSAFHRHARFCVGPLRDQTHGELMYRHLQFYERSQHFIGANDETLSVAMRVNDPNRSTFEINR